jgi:hypothetical protein
VGINVSAKKYPRLKKSLERLIKYALRDIEDEDLRYTVMERLLRVRELLSDGTKPS